MKTIILILLTFSSFITTASLNDETVKIVTKNISKLYENELKSFKKVNFNYFLDQPNKSMSVSLKNNIVTFKVYGGFTSLSNLKEDSLALTFCHEVGHLVGGAPTVQPTKKYSSESQSDYFATNNCLKRYYNAKPLTKNLILTKREKSLCPIRNVLCLNILNAIKSTGLLLEEVGTGKYQGLLHHPKKVAKYTVYNDYVPLDCRIKTMINGLLNKERPKCWFNEKESIKKTGYSEKERYFEALIFGQVVKVKPWKHGCIIHAAYFESYNESYFDPLFEEDVYNEDIHIFGPCPYKKDDEISGTLSMFKEKIYLNINPTDKELGEVNQLHPAKNHLPM